MDRGTDGEFIRARKNMSDALPAAGMAILMKVEGWTKERVDLQVAAARKEMNDMEMHQYAPLYVWIARKPLLADASSTENL